MSTNDHAKVSDSGYANTYDNSQSQRSSGSSLSRNSNRSESSGYCGGHPSNFGFSNEALPQPISKKKEKEHKKKKLKTMSSVEYERMESVHECTDQLKDTGIYSHVSSHLQQVLEKSEEVGTVELMDATEPGEHNGDTKSTIPNGGIGSQTNPLDNTSPNTNEEFYMMISLRDGLVLHSADSMQTFLGFPKNYWLGKSFIDFLHPEDQTVFADNFSNKFLCGNREKDISLRLRHLFCRLRKYSAENSGCSDGTIQQNGLGHGEEKNSEALTYVPFHLTLGLKHFPKYGGDEEKSGMLFLIIIAKQVVSAYTVPEETITSSIFTTRHTATCHLSHVDDDVVRYFGYLPQDMIGQSLFDYYHPEDLPFIKDIYETVVKLKGSSFRSKPYRFAVNNGGYVLLETEWSSFINPWKGKLEFVTGQHRVLRGPMNPNVFQQADEKYKNFRADINEGVLTESRIIQNQIRSLLKEKIQKSTKPNTSVLTANSNEFLSFVESVINEIKGSKIEAKVPSIAVDDRSFSEHDSVMLGEISPHHEYCDSKSSSETPPSYNQLNYKEKIDRFFSSKPLGRAVYGSDEENLNSGVPNRDETDKAGSNDIPITNHDSGGSGSGENLSSESNNQTSFDSRDDSVKENGDLRASDSFQRPTLTEELLNQHNYEMEKLMIQKHKERRSSIKNHKINKDNRMKTEEQQPEHEKSAGKARGTKRISNHNREDELLKAGKFDGKTMKYERVEKNDTTVNKMILDQSHTNTTTWPHMNTIPTLSTTQQYITTSLSSGLAHGNPQCTPFPQIVPVYYLPMSRIRDYVTNTTIVQSNNQLPMPQQFWPNPYGTIYPPVIGPATSAPMIYTSEMIPQGPTAPSTNLQPSAVSPPVIREKPAQRKRPASQATSIKAEPGSIMAMSESSKKPQSPGGRISSCVSLDGGSSSLIDFQNSINALQNPKIISSTEDSSDSSFYGRFLNTSSGSSSNLVSAESLLQQNVKAEKCNEECQTRTCGNFAIINALKATSERQKVASHISSDCNLQRSLKKMNAPWVDGINMTPEIIYQYQMKPKPLDEILKNDMKILNANPQSQLINAQLDQLYLDLELEGFGSKLNLEENDYSTDSDRERSSSEDGTNISPQQKRTRREIKYCTQGMIYEENALLP